MSHIFYVDECVNMCVHSHVNMGIFYLYKYSVCANGIFEYAGLLLIFVSMMSAMFVVRLRFDMNARNMFRMIEHYIRS